MKTIKNHVTVALFAAFSFISTAALANDEKKDSPVVEFKYVGLVQNQPLFQLDLNSLNETDFYVSIKDQRGEVLYSERIKTKKFTRNFRLNTESLDDAVLKVEVRSGNNKPEVFTINRNTRYFEETSVSKL
jgi:hypothetical protein